MPELPKDKKNKYSRVPMLTWSCMGVSCMPDNHRSKSPRPLSYAFSDAQAHANEHNDDTPVRLMGTNYRANVFSDKFYQETASANKISSENGIGSEWAIQANTTPKTTAPNASAANWTVKNPRVTE